MTINYMDNLPDEMYDHILKFLPYKDARKLAMTSRRLHNVVASNADIKLASKYDSFGYFKLKKEFKKHPRAVTKYMDYVYQLAQDTLGNEYIFQRYFNNLHDAVELLYYLNKYKSRDTAGIEIKKQVYHGLEYRIISKGSVEVAEIIDERNNISIAWDTNGVETRREGPSSQTYYAGRLFSEHFHIGGGYNGRLSEIYYYPDGTVKRKWMKGRDDDDSAILIREKYEGPFNPMRSFHLAIKDVLVREYRLSPANADTRARVILNAFREIGYDEVEDLLFFGPAEELLSRIRSIIISYG
jgi:hypothetical protein